MMYLYTSIWLSASSSPEASQSLSLSLYIYIYIYIYMYVCLYVCVNIYIYIYTCIHIHIHTSILGIGDSHRAKIAATSPPLQRRQHSRTYYTASSCPLRSVPRRTRDMQPLVQYGQCPAARKQFTQRRTLVPDRDSPSSGGHPTLNSTERLG